MTLFYALCEGDKCAVATSDYSDDSEKQFILDGLQNMIDEKEYSSFKTFDSQADLDAFAAGFATVIKG